MASKRRKKPKTRQKGNITVAERDSVGPTPETAAKLQQDTLQTIIRNGWIDNAGIRAVEEIRVVRAGITHGLEAKGNKFSTMAHGVKDMADSVAEAHAKRYLPWSQETFPACNLVIQVVYDGKQTDNEMLQKSIARCIQNYAKRLG